MKKLGDYLKENALDSIKDKLCPEIWNDEEKLKSNVKSQIINNFKDWAKKVFPANEIKEIYILGSLTGFQYSEDSDVDVEVVIEGLTKKQIEDAIPILPNGNNIEKTNHPVNYYVLNKMTDLKEKGGCYDVFKDKWIVKENKAEKESLLSNYKATAEISRFFIFGLTSAIYEYEMDKRSFYAYEQFLKESDEMVKNDTKKILKFKLDEIFNDLDGIKIAYHVIWSLRNEAFNDEIEPIEISTVIKSKKGNSSINNLIYKYIEKMGLIGQVKSLLKERSIWQAKLKDY